MIFGIQKLMLDRERQKCLLHKANDDMFVLQDMARSCGKRKGFHCKENCGKSLSVSKQNSVWELNLFKEMDFSTDTEQ